ncbi:hypothetical protein Acry_2887 [Acidiphilium cryptum JF-5]|uniref:Uncharacterized protein n=1 Tax=Acidiphilium cryptum (strain JF-5) TaxID=349163 RepID=A5G2J5_ACICJ|nr:hypothetical protein Acry_2887 [Acidiphilium cryptum JF-5]
MIRPSIVERLQSPLPAQRRMSRHLPTGSNVVRCGLDVPSCRQNDCRTEGAAATWRPGLLFAGRHCGIMFRGLCITEHGAIHDSRDKTRGNHEHDGDPE